MMKRFKTVLTGVAAAAFLSLSAQANVADRIVAVVNDEVITLSELNGAFDPYRAKLEAAYEGQARDKALTEARETLLNRMIDALLKKFSPAKAWVIGSKAINAARSPSRTDARFGKGLVIISYISSFVLYCAIPMLTLIGMKTMLMDMRIRPRSMTCQETFRPIGNE